MRGGEAQSFGGMPREKWGMIEFVLCGSEGRHIVR